MTTWVEQASLKGPKGDKGDQGDLGPPNELVVGTVTTVDYTDPATVVISGEPPLQTIDFEIPAGEPGGAMSASAILTLLKTVDGAGSGLDADLLDGQSSESFAAKTYVDSQDAALASAIGTKANTSYVDSQDATLNAAIATKAPTASPAFTGNPTAPTPTAGDSDTSIATTAFVAAAIAGVGASVGASPPATPSLGKLWWDTDVEVLYIWNGAAWRPVLATWA